MGEKLVRREGLGAAFVLIALACKPGAVPVKVPQAAEPQMKATVVTMQTSLQPSNKTHTHQIVIADGRARSMNELDSWRLIDLTKNRVTFVDDIAKSYRTEDIASLVAKRRTATSAEVPDGAPRVEFISTGAKQAMQGVEAVQSLIRAGEYKRELWVANHPALPPNLYSVLYAAEPVTSSLAPVMKPVDDALLAMRGFPLADHAEMQYGKEKMSVDRRVVKIETKNVPQKWLNVPGDYTEKTTKQPASRPPAASPQPSQRTPGAGSQSSSTGQRTP